MSLPPTTVKIKRKRGDEPPEILRVHETNGKRQRRATEFVFSRQPQQTDFPPPQSGRPINELPKASSSPSLPNQAAIQLDQNGLEPTSSNDSHDPEALLKARRFHISRKPNYAEPPPAVVGGRVEKRSTVFVERMHPYSRPNSRPTSSHGSKTNLRPASQSKPAPEAEQARPQKKPGLASRIPSNRAKDAPALLTTAPPAREVRLPSGETKPWDEASDELAAELQAYTLQEIGHKNRASGVADEITPQSSPQRKAIKSRFVPKKPALRYRDRHPEEQHDEMDKGEPMVFDDEMEDDGEYIIDTYIRMPAHEVGVDTAKNFGLLVLDSQPDIDEFYREDSDHEEEENDDEEDENAEDHYTADYPDEEVDSDDEYDRNAYNYRNNGSDQEEFDEDDAAFSDDEGDKMIHPWGTTPAWLK